MEQPQFRVSFSVGTKLLFSVVTLLFVVIVFLDVSTILILTEDKRAYTYQAQGVQAELLGREFVNTSRTAFDTMRVALAAVDPLKPITSREKDALKNILDNQSLVLWLSIELVNLESAESTRVISSAKSDAFQPGEFAESDVEVKKDALKESISELSKEGFAFFNLSKMGAPPLVGVAFADLTYKDRSKGVPVAFAALPLRGFGREIRSASVTIANRDAQVLFATDPAVQFTLKTVVDLPLFEAAAASQFANGTQEFESGEGVRFLGSFVQPGLNLVVLAKTEWRKAMRATYTLTEKFILLGMMAIGSACIFAVFFSKTLTNPLLRLHDATKEVAAGNFNLQLESKGRDEIGALTGSFNVMSKKISELIVESMEKVRLEAELSIASTVQQTLFPPNEYADQNVRIQGFYQAASECGGDWWGYFGVGDKLSVMIADATGHGLPSALITAAARSCFSVMFKLAQDDPAFTYSPGSMLAYANRVVNEAANGKINMTFFCGVFDFTEKTLTYSSAGHNPPWLFKASGGGFALKSLVAVGQRLGEAHEVPPYDEKSVPIGPGDILFLYTDGLTEGKDKEGNQYGKKRARRVIEDNLPQGPLKVIENLIADFKVHNGEKPLDDDVTLSAMLLFPGAQA